MRYIIDLYADNKLINLLAVAHISKLSFELKTKEFEQSKYLMKLLEQYFFQFTLPLVEILQELDISNITLSYNDLIYSHYLFCIHARFVDNIFDNDFESLNKIQSLLLANTTFHKARSSFINSGLLWTDELSNLYYEMYSYEAELPQMKSILIRHLYKRVSCLLILPTCLNELIPTNFLNTYINYINFMLLIHDLHDVLDDVKKKKRTYITDLLSQSPAFRQKTINAVFKEVFSELSTMAEEIKDNHNNIFFFREVFPVIEFNFLNSQEK